MHNRAVTVWDSNQRQGREALTPSATIVVGASLAKPKSRIFAWSRLVTQHADERDYRNIADGLGGPLYGLCDLDAITPLCLGLV